MSFRHHKNDLKFQHVYSWRAGQVRPFRGGSARAPAYDVLEISSPRCWKDMSSKRELLLYFLHFHV